jgi:hypothetical protein
MDHATFLFLKVFVAFAMCFKHHADRELGRLLGVAAGHPSVGTGRR